MIWDLLVFRAVEVRQDECRCHNYFVVDFVHEERRDESLMRKWQSIWVAEENIVVFWRNWVTNGGLKEGSDFRMCS